MFTTWNWDKWLWSRLHQISLQRQRHYILWRKLPHICVHPIVCILSPLLAAVSAPKHPSFSSPLSGLSWTSPVEKYSANTKKKKSKASCFENRWKKCFDNLLFMGLSALSRFLEHDKAHFFQLIVIRLEAQKNWPTLLSSKCFVIRKNPIHPLEANKLLSQENKLTQTPSDNITLILPKPIMKDQKRS